MYFKAIVDNIILLTLCYYSPSGNPIKLHDEFSSLQSLCVPTYYYVEKRFDNFTALDWVDDDAQKIVWMHSDFSLNKKSYRQQHKAITI